MVRWLLAGVGGLLTASAFFLLMQALIAQDAKAPQARPSLAQVDFIDRPERSEPPPPPTEPPPEPPPPEPAPPKPEPVRLNPMPKPSQQQPELAADHSFRPDLGGLPGLGRGPRLGTGKTGVNQGLTPIQRIPPSYPRWAARQRLEGWVKVAFTVNPQGEVTDAKVIEAEPSGVFDRAALRAIRRWRFRPPTQGGEPVAQRAVQILKFNLENS